MIDILIKYAYAFIVLTTLPPVFIPYLNYEDAWSLNALYIVLLFPVFIYSLTLETLFNGQTVGKKIMNIKVIKIQGYKTSFFDHLTRWVFRPVDFTSSFGVVGFVCVTATKNHQRLGDLAAGTAVVSLNKSLHIHHTILEEISDEYIPTYPDVVKLSDNDIRIIKETYSRAIRYGDSPTIKKLIMKIEEVSGIKPEANIDTFITKIIKDYNYYTGQ